MTETKMIADASTKSSRDSYPMDSSLAEQQHWALQLVPRPSAFVASKSRIEHNRTTATDRHSIESAAIGTGRSRDRITNRYQTASTRTAHCPFWTIHGEHDYQGGRFEDRLSFALPEGRLWGTSIGNAGEQEETVEPPQSQAVSTNPGSRRHEAEMSYDGGAAMDSSSQFFLQRCAAICDGNADVEESIIIHDTLDCSIQVLV
jgi:hypothetical protein